MEVLSASSAGDSGGESPDGSHSVRGLATNLYNLFLSETPASAALSPPMIPAAVPSAAPTPEATGCGFNGVTKTVIVYAGINGEAARLRVALERTNEFAQQARRRRNVVHYVFLGGALPPHGAQDERVVEQLVTLKTQGNTDYDIEAELVHLIAGPREIQSMSLVAEGVATTGLAEYLQKCKLVECLGPDGMDEKGTGGLWLKCTGTQCGEMVGKLPGIGANGPRVEWIPAGASLSKIAWKDELNKRWSEVASNPKAVRDNPSARARWQFWMTLGVKSALDEDALPAEGLDLGANNSVAVFARHTAAFGTVRHTLQINKKSLMRTPVDYWMDVGITSDSLYWAVNTWCYSTAKAMNMHKSLMLDRTPNISDLQYDVNCTLGSLVQHSERANALTPPVYPWANFGRLRGQLGPCVDAGRGGQEILRVVHWTTMDPTVPDVVMLLPEQYVRYVLHDYFQELVSVVDLGSRAVSGFLVLDDESIVAMRVPGLSPVEQMHANEAMGVRLWKLPTGNKSASGALGDIAAGPFVPGNRINSAGRHIFYTHTTSADPLSGLYVKWVFAPGHCADAKDMPTLDIANDAFELTVE